MYSIIAAVAFVAILIFIGTVLTYSAHRELLESDRQLISNSQVHVVSKHLEVTNSLLSKMVSTNYYVTFEEKDGHRRQFQVEGGQYGMIAEGDHGVLTSQGTRFHRFQRT